MPKYILLVDDDNSMRKSLSLYLIDKGFSVTSCKDVHSAYLSLKERMPDIIISDILMPKGNGYNLLKFLNDDPVYTKILFIFLTVKGMTPDRILGYKLGCQAYLTKPFDPEELVYIIKSLLNKFYQHKKQSNISQYIQNHNYKFTYREKTILDLVLQGKRNKEIANILALSLRNVEKYVSRLLFKTGKCNRTELVKYFCQLKFDL
jgi:DNA-binding NarL/FixJ family response regulator